MEELLESLHRPPRAVARDLAMWIDAHRARPARSPLADAVLGGAEAGTIGLAFLSGYQAALRALVPELPRRIIAALAATETGGGHPKAIETRYEQGQLVGHKRYITLGAQAELLLVVARRSLSERTLVVVKVERSQAGLSFEPLPALPFAPELPHAELRIETKVPEHQVLPGDGYLDYLKPFRTLEDLHVLCAILAHAAQRARATGASHALREGIAADIAGLGSLAALSPRSAAVHVALGGLLPRAAALLQELSAHLQTASSAEAEIWSRDLALLGVASGVRLKRLERAWEVLG